MSSATSITSDTCLIDTNVLLRSVEGGQPMHATAHQALQQLTKAGVALCITPQNLIEFWVVATRPLAANGLGLTPEEAEKELELIHRTLGRIGQISSQITMGSRRFDVSVRVGRPLGERDARPVETRDTRTSPVSP